MNIGKLIEKLKELPENCDIYFCDYDKTYDNEEVMWILQKKSGKRENTRMNHIFI